MIIIKRYPNRKLYNTTAKCYVTLEGIADLIREGNEIQILDHSSGEDLTAVTLTQIIFEQEKKEGGFLPRSVLTGLVQSGGQTLSSIRRTLASPLNLKLHVDQEIERRLTDLVSAGEINEEEATELGAMLGSTSGQQIDQAVPSEIEMERLLTQRGIPTREEIQSLNSRLDQLMTRLGAVEPEEPSGSSSDQA